MTNLTMTMDRKERHMTVTAVLAVTVLAALTLLPCPARAQDTSRNFVRSVTMLNASGTDSLEAVQYCDGLGRPTVAVATVGSQGQTACTLTTYDGSGRERRRYVPVPGSGLGYMAESDVQAASYGFYMDSGGFTESHYDALGRVTAVSIAGDAWKQAGRQDRTVYLANTLADGVLHYEAPEDGTFSLTLPENTSFQYYPAGSLIKTVSYDADSTCITVFTNLLGDSTFVVGQRDQTVQYYHNGKNTISMSWEQWKKLSGLSR